MQTWEVLVLILIGMAFLAGLSAALHMALPTSVLEGANRHGRYFGLGAPHRPHDPTAGNAPARGPHRLAGHFA